MAGPKKFGYLKTPASHPQVKHLRTRIVFRGQVGGAGDFVVTRKGHIFRENPDGTLGELTKTAFKRAVRNLRQEKDYPFRQEKHMHGEF